MNSSFRQGVPAALSFAQERLWVLDRLHPGSAFYNMPIAWRFRGALDKTVLARALGEILRRHEVLRTRFVEVDGTPVQMIAPFDGCPMPVADLSGLSAEEQAAAVRREVAAEAALPFNLGSGPLFRTKLLRLEEQEHVLLLSMHHIVSDWWSLGVLFRELGTLYAACRAYRSGGEPPLPELTVQYADYALWQRAQLQGAVLERELAYWKARLAGAPAVLDLPTDRPRPAVQTDRGADEAIELSPVLLEQLRALARRERVTLFMMLLGAFQALLAKCSGSEDVVVGSPIAGRPRREFENLIGFFANTLVLRTDFSGDPSFHEVLGRVRHVTMGAYEHQQVPFEKLVAELQPERTLSHSPLFQVWFTVDFDDPIDGGIPGLQVAPMPGEGAATRFDLRLGFRAYENSLRAAVTYSTDLFERQTIVRMLAHLERLLEQVVADPDVRLSELTLVDAAERQQLVEAWNGASIDDPRDRLIHELFEEHVGQTPDAVAAVCGTATLTYAALNVQANALAQELIALGVGPDVRVGLCLERSLELVVAMLAVLKAGGAYVPLEPRYPAERLRVVFTDADVRVLLTQAPWRAALPAVAGVPVLTVDGSRAARGAANPRTGVTPQHLAYVIYTSGSTGTPKGVAVPHAGLSRYLGWTARTFATHSAPVLSSCAFDLAVTSVWVPLVSGGTLDLMAEPDAVERLAQRLVQGARYGLVKLTPTHLQALGAVLTDRTIAGGVEWLVVGGESLMGEHLEDWARRCPTTMLVNHYGPTETVVGCCFHARPLRDVGPGRVPIGRPAPGVQVYVLNGARQPVPVGVTGELYVGGGQMARGYLARAALTAERFVPDAFGRAPGGRLYRTGDRVRWLADGTLEYLGRLDAQVKIRGFRIEPGEIEAVLTRAPGVREARVVARATAGEPQLVAYVVGEASAEALRAHVRAQVPEYLVPAAFVRLEALPRTPNGKLDLTALPAPDRTHEGAPYAAPQTPVEAVLAEIWAAVLRLDRVGRTDNFFALGGDSIMAIQVVSRARRAGLAVMPRQVFEHQTIAALASVIGETARTVGADERRVDGRVGLTPIQAWFFEQKHPVPSHYNQSMLLTAPIHVSDGTIEAAVKGVVAHHDALRLRFHATQAGWEQGYGAEAGIKLERTDLRGHPAAEQDQLQSAIAERLQASLDLDRGPLGRAMLFDRGNGDRALLLVLHHLVVDGVSWRILREDLERACAQISAGTPIALGGKSTSYREWAEAMQRYAASETVAAEARYWQAQDPFGTRPLATDEAGEPTVERSRTVTVQLEEAETRQLLQEVPPAYRTQINDVLLCALAEAVEEWTGRSRVRLTLEGHGREEAVGAGLDLTRTVGWLTSVYPVTLDLSGANGPGERLTQVKEQLRAVPTHGIGYGALRYLSPDAQVRDALASQAAPEILFNYLGQFDQGEAVEGGFRFRVGPRGADAAAVNRRSHRLLISGSVRGGCLRLHWTYAEGTYKRTTIERVAGAYLDALRALIAHCCESGAGGYTPSDFPLAGLTQAELDAVLGRSGRPVSAQSAL